jgi:hypothetical protein
VSVKLVVEVLDHYHGPTHRKLWLIAWAEKVTGESRIGYCKREVLAARLGRSPSRVSHIARELEDEGTIKRLGGGVWGKAAVYELLPLDASQGDPRAHPTQGDPRAHPTAEPGTHPVSAPATHSQGHPRAHPIPDNPDKPSSASRRTTRTGSSGGAAATDDDDDSVTSHPLGNTATDVRLILAGMGATEDEAEFGIRLLARLTPDPAGYLRGKSGDPEAFMHWLRRERQLDGQDPEAGP